MQSKISVQLTPCPRKNYPAPVVKDRELNDGHERTLFLLCSSSFSIFNYLQPHRLKGTHAIELDEEGRHFLRRIGHILVQPPLDQSHVG